MVPASVISGYAFVPTTLGFDAAYGTTIKTGLRSDELSALSISSVEFTLNDSIVATWASGDVSFSAQLYKGPKITGETSVPPSSRRYVCGFDFNLMDGAAAAGGVEVPMFKRWDAPRGGVLIAGESFTIRIDSTATQTRNGVYYRVFYKPVKITVGQLIELTTY